MRWAASMSMTLMRVSIPCLGSVSKPTSMRGLSTRMTWCMRSPTTKSDLPPEFTTKLVCPTVCPGVCIAREAGGTAWASLENRGAPPVGDGFLARGGRRALGGGAGPLVVGPESRVGLGDIDLRVGKIAAATRRHDPADVVDVRM